MEVIQTCLRLEGLGSTRLLHSPSKAWGPVLLLRLLLLNTLLLLLLLDWPMSSMRALPAIILHVLFPIGVAIGPSLWLLTASTMDVWLVAAVLIMRFQVIIFAKVIYGHLVTSILRIARYWRNFREVDSCIGMLPVVDQPI